MLSDPIDYVRQGALLATSMVLMQNAQHEPDSRLSAHRKLLQKVISDKHEDSMAKFGAIIATGLLDAGGRNMSISLLSKSGHKVMPAIVGIGVFTHFWCVLRARTRPRDAPRIPRRRRCSRAGACSCRHHGRVTAAAPAHHARVRDPPS